MTNRKKIIYLLLIIWLVWISTYFFIRVDIKGNKNIRLKKGEEYVEKGAIGTFLWSDLKVKISSNLNTNKLGTYEIKYKARNIFGIAKTKKRVITVYDAEKPLIKLKGNLIEIVPLDSPYIEKGYHAEDNIDGDITEKVIIDNKVDTKKEGIYEIIYRVKDSSNNETTIKRVVRVQGKLLRYQDKYDATDNTKKGWWTDNKFDHQRPAGGDDINKLKEYSAYFMGPDDKTIYLTFDEGSNDTYLDKIADILTKNDVQATFFLCGHYMESNKDLVKKWVKNGHSIGNHTYHHRSTPLYANRKGFTEFQEEITSMEDLYQEITGTPMDKIYRDPKGEWSYRVLQMVQDMGYKSFLWSADYLDFDKTYTKEYALEQMMKRYHNGAIYLLHPKQKGTYEALEDFIKEMKKLGYKFGLVRDINY